MALVAAAGIRVFSVTDHDTVDALGPAAALAAQLDVEFVTGIEVSARIDGTDVHVLGYMFDPSSPPLLEFLRSRAQDRIRRVHAMCARLSDLGAPVPADTVLARASAAAATAVGRPHVARALVERGHVADVEEAFDRFLAAGRPAHVPHVGPTPQEAIDIVTRARGLASLAHPGLLGRDDAIAGLVRSGLQAIEAFHTDHDAGTTRQYEEMAAALGVSVTGGSDYHGEGAARARALGSARLPERHYEALLARARRAGCARVPRRRAEDSGGRTP